MSAIPPSRPARCPRALRREHYGGPLHAFALRRGNGGVPDAIAEVIAQGPRLPAPRVPGPATARPREGTWRCAELRPTGRLFLASHLKAHTRRHGPVLWDLAGRRLGMFSRYVRVVLPYPQT